MSWDANTAQRSGGQAITNPPSNFWTKRWSKIYKTEIANSHTMQPQDSLIRFSDRWRRPRGRRFLLFIALTFLALPSRAHASMFHGETLDSVASVIAWFAFIIVPPVLIGVFLLVHILPEKIAEKRHHPQLGAIKC